MASFPLSYNQLSVWYLHTFAPRSPAYHLAFCARITSPLDPGRLERALADVVAVTPMLRATISVTGGTPVQTVHESRPPTVERFDVAGDSDEELTARLQADYERPFDLAARPGLRASLYRRADTDHVLLLTVHHAFVDGWSVTLMVEALCRAYAGEQLIADPDGYREFVTRQREFMASGDGARQRDYWAAELGAAPVVLDLPPDKPRPPLQSLRGAAVSFTVDAATTRGLVALARQERSSTFRVLLAACHVALARCTEQDEVLIGSPVSGRTRPGLAQVIGHCVNMIVLRGDLRAAPTFREFLRRVDAAVRGALDNQDYPFAALVERLQPTRDASRSPLFQVCFAFQRQAIEELTNFFIGSAPGRPGFELGGLRFEPVVLSQQQGAFDISLWMARSGDELIGELKYASDLFERHTGERMVALLQTLLHEIAADPDREVTRIPLLDEAQRAAIVEGWNDTARRYRTDVCLHTLVAEQVRRSPQAAAVRHGVRSLTYRELDHAADRIAGHLRAHGVDRHGLVGVYLDRSMEMVPALLGVLKAGAGYVPLDPAHPVARTDAILSSLPVSCALTQSHLVPRLQGLAAPALRHLVCLDEGAVAPAGGPRTVAGAAALAAVAVEAPPEVSEPGDTAYLIFTSGSTGTPKGVEVAHRPVVNLIEWVNRTYRVGPGDRILQVTSLCFDLSVYDVFGGLAAGACLVLADADDVRDPRRLAALLLDERITFWNSAPPALQQLVAFLPARVQAPALRLVFLSGDWIPLPLPDAVRAVFPGAHLVGLGGATEATVWSNYYDIGQIEDRWVSIPYGRPIQNARYYVLDPHGNPCPVGIPGELFIGGQCLAMGYRGDPELTAAKFVPDPFVPGARMYRTGDRARFYRDGNIEFLGRRDFQVKVRGYRIELGEIESVLLQHEGVAECLALARDDDGERELVAYLVPSGAGELTVSGVRSFVGERLPSYMVPAQVVVVDAMPMTANGKIDRRALPAPQRRRDEAARYVEPRTDSERLVARTWGEVLRLDRVGALDDFFALGGHSLQAVEIVHALEQATGRRLPLSVLLGAPTVADLAAELGGAGGASLLVPLSGGDGPTVFCLHPSGGEVLAYRALAQRLPAGWAVVGVRSRALLGEPEHPDLTAMARDYAAVLLAARPDGPFLLLGWSMGGVLAHAVAARLRAEGRIVAYLGLIDAALPAGRPDHTEHPAWRLAAAFGGLAGAVAELPRAERDAAVAEVLALPDDHRPGAALRIASARGLVPQGATLSAFATQAELARTHEELLLAHRAPQLDVALHLVWAQETLVDGAPPTEWADTTTGPVESRTVPGNHYTLLTPSGLDGFAAELAGQLELAVKTSG